MLHFLLLLIEFLTAFVILCIAFGFAMNHALKSKGYSGPVSDHFNGTHFFSIGSTHGKEDSIKENVESIEEGDREPQPKSMLAWMFERGRNKWLDRKVEPIVPEARVDGDKLVVTFINHASVLIQTQGLNILTDPHWSKRASPFSWIGPRRYQDPGVRFDDLPHIDIVLLSHNHYDHMDLPTVERLYKEFFPKIFSTLGNSEYLASRGIPNAVDMDWWDKQKISNEIDLACVPSQHFAARAISDRNKTLWGGFVLEIKSGDVYFAGDTGFGPWVSKLAAAYPNGFRLALLPIGAFKPRSFMKEVHISPTEAMTIKERIKAKEAVAIHFGTFRLAGDRQDEPMEAINSKARSASGHGGSFVVLKNGGTLTVK